MKKIVPAILIALICFFTACKKNIVLDEKTTSPAEASLQQIIPCEIREDAAKTTAAKRGASKPSEAPVVLLLDFNGQLVSNPGWNLNVPFNCPAVSSSLLSTANKDKIMQSVIEDYSAFKVRVTQSESEYQNYRILRSI